MPPRQDSQATTELGDQIQRLEELANVGTVTSSPTKQVALSPDVLARLNDAIKAKIGAPFQAFEEAQNEGDLKKVRKASDDLMELLVKLKVNPEDPSVRFLACVADSYRRMAELPKDPQDQIQQAFRLGTESGRFFAEKRYAQAVECGRQATAIYSEHLGASDFFAVASLFQCGRMLVLAGEEEMALQDLDRAVGNCSAGPAGKTVFYTALLDEQARICRYLMEQERLLACLRRTATAWKDNAGVQSNQHVTSLRILATELFKMEHLEEAGRVCQEALQMPEPVKARSDLAGELVAINLIQAAICHKRGDYPAAVESLQAVVGAAEKDGPDDPESASEFFDLLAESLEKVDRAHEAAQARTKAEVWRLQIQMTSEFPLPKSN
jgi:tetratricopeptide (TPR) repeat protein